MVSPRTRYPVGTAAGRRLLWLGVAGLIVFLLAPTSTSALLIRKLNGPQSFLALPDDRGYFISNVNGEPTDRDNNGFITKLDSEGQLIHRQFIKGGRAGVVLHAPQGMAVVGTVLYVADLEALRAFDTETGQPVTTVTVSQGKRSQGSTQGLADVAHDGAGVLYASDFGTNTIYRIDTKRDHAVSVVVSDESLAGPRGVAVHPRTGHLIVVSWNEGTIFQIDAAGTLTVLVSNSFFSSRFNNLDGVDFDVWGNMYVSDFTAGKIWRMRPDGKFQVIAEHLPTPAGIGVDRKNHLILVPYLYANAAEMNGMESPIKRRKKNRTLADYGFTVPKPPKEEDEESGD